MRRARRDILIVLAGGLLACGSGCAKDEAATSAEPNDTGITRTEIRGPVKLTVKTDRSRASIAERFTLTITAEAEDGVDVEMPEFGESLGELTIRDFRDVEGRPIEGGKRRWKQIYEIDAELSGTYKVKPITVEFVDRRKETLRTAPPTTSPTSQPGVRAGLTAEGFELEVTSLLEGEFDPTQFRDVKPPAEIPEPPSRWYAWVIGGFAGLGVLVVIVVLLARRLRGRGPKEITVSPHEWAMDRLQALIDEDLIGQGQVQEFYYRLNAILRQYIELRFGLMAPEMTTEEFLDALRTSDALRPDHKESLERFLAACDLVKYARYEPGSDEVEQVFATARDFIEQTTEPGKRVVALPEEEEAEVFLT